MLQKPCKTLSFKENMVYKIPGGGGGAGKPYPVAYSGEFTARRRLRVFTHHISIWRMTKKR